MQDIALLIFATTALALVLNPFQVGFVKLLEGYGPDNRALEWLRMRGRRRYEARYQYLEALSAPPEHGAPLTDAERLRIEEQGQRADDQLAEMPRYGRLMPTRLGNALRSAEDHAGRRYGLDAIEVIPRGGRCPWSPNAGVWSFGPNAVASGRKRECSNRRGAAHSSPPFPLRRLPVWLARGGSDPPAVPPRAVLVAGSGEDDRPLRAQDRASSVPT